MYGLAVGTDVSALQGCTLGFIGLSRFQLQLGLDSRRGIGVSIEGDFALTAADGTTTLYEWAADAAQPLADRLDVEVVEAHVASPGTLTLKFADGTTLDIYDSKDRYESYQINIGKRLIVV